MNDLNIFTATVIFNKSSIGKNIKGCLLVIDKSFVTIVNENNELLFKSTTKNLVINRISDASITLKSADSKGAITFMGGGELFSKALLQFANNTFVGMVYDQVSSGAITYEVEELQRISGIEETINLLRQRGAIINDSRNMTQLAIPLIVLGVVTLLVFLYILMRSAS